MLDHLGPSPQPSRGAAITDLYIRLLGRLPDGESIRHHHASGEPLDRIEAKFEASDERQAVLRGLDVVREAIARSGRAKNVLLFGAYGNGNMGDAIMASTVAPHLEEICDVGVFAYSLLDIAPYPFRPDRLLRRGSQLPQYGLVNPVVLQAFDALVIGGGGLLAYPHAPLWDPNWPHIVPIPYALHACGVGRPLAPEVENLVRHARCASARDPAGLAELRDLTPAAVLCPDPVLARYEVARDDVNRPGRAYVLRGPLRAHHREIQSQLTSDDLVLGMEIGVDWPLVSLFPNMTFASSPDQLLDAFARCGMVVSERYHGAILAMKSGRAVFGLTRGDHNTDKLVELFAAIGASTWCGPRWSAPASPYPHDAAQRFVADAADRYHQAVEAMVMALGLRSA